MSFNTAYAGFANWLIPSGAGTDGDYYIYYKFSDYANNESSTPGRLKVSLDNTSPTLTSVQINSAGGYTNNTNDSINITLNANDDITELSQKQKRMTLLAKPTKKKAKKK